MGSVESRKAGSIEPDSEFVLSEIPADCVKVTDWYDEILKLAAFNVVKSADWTNG